ncbi:uncharacterized protein [Watersipora subatra]|uniref:uncharacterized protein n=1 Tax=Watersipora subatra TaxID=2589382 RepID=UPI00355C7DED
MFNLKGFEEATEEHFKTFENVNEVAQNNFSNAMRVILYKKSTNIVLVVREPKHQIFIAIHVPFWDIIRADGKCGITKDHSQTEMTILTNGLKQRGFTMLELYEGYDGGELNFSVIQQRLVVILENISSYCDLFLLSFSMHGFQGHLGDADGAHEEIQKFVGLLNMHLKWTSKVMALQTCRHVPEKYDNDPDRQKLKATSDKLHTSVFFKTKNMMVMMAEEVGKKYYSSGAERSYLSELGKAMQCVRQLPQLNMYEFHLQAHDWNKKKAKNTIYYSHEYQDIPKMLLYDGHTNPQEN